MTLGAVKLPTRGQIAELAEELGFSMSDEELAVHLEAMRPNIDAYNAVDRMPQALPPVKYPRTPGYRPSGGENRYGAWYVKTTIEGAPDGKLKGKRVVLKDNVCLAGVPMMNGAST
ncbi:MAG: amidase, partial [Geminicoccales bacterium]